MFVLGKSHIVKARQSFRYRPHTDVLLWNAGSGSWTQDAVHISQRSIPPVNKKLEFLFACSFGGASKCTFSCRWAWDYLHGSFPRSCRLLSFQAWITVDRRCSCLAGQESGFIVISYCVKKNINQAVRVSIFYNNPVGQSQAYGHWWAHGFSV